MLTNYQTLNRSLEHKGGVYQDVLHKDCMTSRKDKLSYVGFAEKKYNSLVRSDGRVGTSSCCHLLCTFEDKAKDKNSGD